jgi:hypothetical protein
MIANVDIKMIVIKGGNNCSATLRSNTKIIASNLKYIMVVAIISADDTSRPDSLSSP